MLESIEKFLATTGVAKLFGENGWWQYIVMYVIIGALFYFAIVKKFEPLLLLPIAFGMLLANLPGAELIHTDFFFNDHYLTVTDFGALEDIIKDPRMVEFLEFIPKSLYNISESNVISFDFSKEALDAANITFEAIEQKFVDLFGNVAFLDETGIYQAGEALGYNLNEFLTSIHHSLFSINDQGIVVLDLSENAFKTAKLNYETALPLIKEQFSLLLGDNAYLKDSVIHIRMSTMIGEVINHGGLFDFLYLGVKLGIYPSLIFLGVGAMTDFSPLISNPKSLFMGAGAQVGVFAAFFGALLLGFTPAEAGSIGIIGGADGPTAILVTKTLAPHLLGAIAIAAYSYMALIPIIQPPFMRLLTTKKERAIKMTNLRPVSKTEKIIFPIVVTLVVTLIIPDAAPLIGFLMLGNLFNVSGVTDRLSKTGQNELINIVTIFLGVSVGATANAENFLKIDTLLIILLGLTAFIISTVGGLLTGKIMCKLSGGKINPLIGSAGVSAVPMAARVAQDEGRKTDPSNFLLMHAMGPNVAGVIGSAVAAGVFLSFLGG